MPQSELDLYDNRLFPKEAERVLLSKLYDRFATKWKTHVKKEVMRQLDTYDILFMTLHKLGDLGNNARKQNAKTGYPHQLLGLDVVLVEEAAQVLEAHMCNATALLSDKTRLVQVGDHMQLPATCRSIENKANAIDRSQFQRLYMTGFVECITLHEQHRSVPIIAAYPSRAFYGNALINAGGPKKLPVNFPFASSFQEPMVFINVDAKHEEKRGKSFCNYSEVDEVIKVVTHLIKGGDVKQEDIAVISPYIY